MFFQTYSPRRSISIFINLFIVLFLLTSCSHPGSGKTSGDKQLTVLLINDIYRINGVEGGTAGGLARVRTLRKELLKEDPEALLVHAGDILFPSMLSRSYQGEQMIDILNLLDGDATGFDNSFYATFGNHEFDRPKLKHASMLNSRVNESQFNWLASNIHFANGEDDKPLVAADHMKTYDLIERNGIKVGLFSVTTDVKIPAYITAIEDPVETARAMTAMLREKGADIVIALTHLTMGQDMEILNKLKAAGPDVIFGGHEHIKLTGKSDGRYVFKADADARSALVAKISFNPGSRVDISYEYHDLDQSVTIDRIVQDKVDLWLVRHDNEYCESKKKQPGCLSEPLGKTAVNLVGEELQIRSIETNLGNWVADQALNAFREDGAQAAFLNSGGLRLNQNLPPNSDITGQTLFELFAYPSPLYMIKIDGATLQRVIEHSISRWPGEGRWLQIAGFAWRHHEKDHRVDGLTLLTENGPSPIRPDETLLVVVNNFLIDPAIGD